jgi:hypothetical protein
MLLSIIEKSEDQAYCITIASGSNWEEDDWLSGFFVFYIYTIVNLLLQVG